MTAQRGRTSLLATGLVAVVAFASALPIVAQPVFTEVAVAAGLGTEIYSSSTLHSLGATWIDFNEDGLPDLFVVNGFGLSPHLYQNAGDGTFILVDELLPPLPSVEMPGAAFADYDNDGDSDIYIFTDNEFLELNNSTNPPDGPLNLLLRNRWVENGGQINPGEPLFEDVASEALVADDASPPTGPYPGWRAITGGWVDYDRDGWIDLYVGHWHTGHAGEETNRDRLYRNLGNGTFEDTSITSGIQPGVDPDTYRPALAFFSGHLDQDLWPDLYVGNVVGLPPYSMDFYFRNNADSTFSDVTGESPGIGDDAAAAMGVTVADIELDGDWDLYITDIYGGASAPPRGNVLYINNGDGTFQDNSATAAGVEADSSWPANFFDADQDGYEDLYVGTSADFKPSFFFLNDGSVGPGTFTDISLASGFGVEGMARGSAVADYDGDGDQDLVVVNHSSRLQLFRNDTPNAGHWLQIRLEGTVGNRDAIGAVVKVFAGELQMRRQITGVSSEHSQDSLVVHFGLGGETEAQVVQILWPSGVTEILENIAADQLLEVTEPEAPGISFTDVTVSAGLNFSHGYIGGSGNFYERIGAGIAVGDYDNDDLLDLYMVRGSIGPNLLFHNLGDGSFEEVGGAAGVGIDNSRGSGPRFFDSDGDGWLDLLVGSVTGGDSRLFKNLGDGTFEDLTATAGISTGRTSYAATFADIDRDHDLDIAQTHWGTKADFCEAAIPCVGHVWLNNGDNTYAEGDAATGVVFPIGGLDHTFDASFADLNNDLWPDLLLASDYGTSQVFVNDGDGTFTETTDPLVITDEAGMGGELVDYDGDGDLDWFVTSIFGGPENPNFAGTTGNRLYRNLGDGSFEDVTAETGPRIGDWGWGPCFADFDNDGNFDIFHVNGWAQNGFEEDLSKLFLSNGDGTFTQMAGLLGLEDSGQGRGVSCLDFDRDGDIDVLVSNSEQEPSLFRNDGGNAKNFLNISLLSRTKNVDGIGAKLHVELDNGSDHHLEMRSGGGFVSQHPHEIHLGLDDATVADAIEVTWPDGIVNTYANVAANQFVELKQIYDSLGLYIPMPGPQAKSARWKLKNLNEPGPSELVFSFGTANDGTEWYAIGGDWDADQVDSGGLWMRNLGRFRLKHSNSSGPADLVFHFGPFGADATPLAGDWDGDGTDTVGIYTANTRTFHLRNTNDHGGADLQFKFGVSGTPGSAFVPVVGDWDGDGVDTVGLLKPATGEFFLRNSNTVGAPEITFQFGPAGGDLLPLSGDWDGDGVDTVGVWDLDDSNFYLTNENSAGPEDIKIRFGGEGPGIVPLGGMWN